MYTPPTYRRLEHLKSSSENLVYSFKCKKCCKQYTDGTEDFRPRFNNYTCARKKKNILKTKKGNYGSFNAHFAEMNHIDENGWENRLIDQLNKVELKKKGSFFWQHEMNTF